MRDATKRGVAAGVPATDAKALALATAPGHRGTGAPGHRATDRTFLVTRDKIYAEDRKDGSNRKEGDDRYEQPGLCL